MIPRKKISFIANVYFMIVVGSVCAMTDDKSIDDVQSSLERLVLEDNSFLPGCVSGRADLTSVTKTSQTSPVLTARSPDTYRVSETRGDEKLSVIITPASETRTIDQKNIDQKMHCSEMRALFKAVREGNVEYIEKARERGWTNKQCFDPKAKKLREPLSLIWVAMNIVFASKDNQESGKIQKNKLKVLEEILKGSTECEWIESKKPHTLHSILCYLCCCGCEGAVIEISPVHRAAQKGHVPMLQLFKKYFKMDLGHKGSGAWNPLMHAVAAKKEEAVCFLVRDVETESIYAVDCFCGDCSSQLCLTCHKPTRNALKSAKDYKEMWCCLCCFCDGCENV